MEHQLALIDESEADYRLDERTREIGRRGIAAAREALRKANAAAASADRGRRRTAA